MPPPAEDKRCYASVAQRETLLDLLRHGDVAGTFFLTGGTALSAFYLHHRQSNDIDLFTRESVDLGALDFNLKTSFSSRYTKIKSSQNFLSLLINNVKIDFVIDPFSFDEPRPEYEIEAHLFLRLDTVRSIASNKLCAIVSRTEPKDFVDYYILFKKIEGLSFEKVLHDARAKEALFDDPPTAAYQMEQTLAFLRSSGQAFPSLLEPLNRQELFDFYDHTIQHLYGYRV
jgi:predicted nucleotidyltransferase component of viral defense system